MSLYIEFIIPFMIATHQVISVSVIVSWKVNTIVTSLNL
jgi:hypothetical protein